ncbi:hypothetical protein DVT68_17270 [Dyella solisilvae]|uniref:Outer membrane protein beta-barrel domain-containing protein n=1 Tax=Dyella solisilvae TaxID=1920168 RepID=A0A370K635_9GAMM|nr:hypothetical protein [Dyella solisilvae]RDI97490.1 hypothetical protein DVT68_17270 [Dyella solisilvae]
MKIVTACITATLLLTCLQARADDDKDIPVRIEFGGAGEWSLEDHQIQRGPSVAIEFEGFKDYEIEVGTAPLRHGHTTEWNTDVIIKKEYALSPHFEFEAGLGPEWNHTVGSHISNSAGAEVEAELIYWTSERHHFGWYLEPAYGYDFGKEHEQSLGIGIGLTVPLF